MQPTYAGIILDQNVGEIFDYSIPTELQEVIQIGSRVIVPLRQQEAKGTVWSLQNTTVASYTKPILQIAIEPSVLTKDLILLVEWMSRYYMTPLSKVLTIVLPKHVRNHEKERTDAIIQSPLSPTELLCFLEQNPQLHKAQKTVLEQLLRSSSPMTMRVLAKKAQVSMSPIQTLIKKGLLHIEKVPKKAIDTLQADYFLSPAKILSEEQAKALDAIEHTLSHNQFHCHLLYGITGSGKTEIYLQAIASALAQHKSVLFLVPEIALATQTIDRLKSRFQENIAIVHHRLSPGERKDNWHDIYAKRARIVVGARSAIFCPLPDLGLIIVDEEHDSAYKHQGEAPCYQGRDVAIMRGKMASCAVVLGSATPSLESYYNALQGKYTCSVLTKRPADATLPHVHIVDMRQESLKQKRKAIFSDVLLQAIKKRLAMGEQTLLLLNRRGYHTSQVCPSCSYSAKCPHCEALLTFHWQDKLLSCHLCGYLTRPHASCPSCHATESMKFSGVGTELVEKALYALFPDCRVLRMDADTTKKKESHLTIIKKFRSGKADILVGTQMIAKGLHFPLVTLVGVLDADLTLQIPDFRASESLFQLITQVAGRAGRSELSGEVFLQTHLPELSSLQQAAQQNYVHFFEEEISSRQLFHYPPFTHCIKIQLQGKDEAIVQKKAEDARGFLIQRLPSFVTLLPVAPCGHAKIDNHYRFQFLLKTPHILPLSTLLMEFQKKFRSSAISLLIDVDPISTFF